MSLEHELAEQVERADVLELQVNVQHERIVDLEALVQDYEALLANIQVHCPIGKSRIGRADALHDRTREMGIVPSANS